MSEQPTTIRVLVAEDNALERSTLVDLLGALGHMVVAEVDSGTAAIEKAQQFTPDAVLLDMHMPGATGVQAAVTRTRTIACRGIDMTNTP